MTKRSRSLFDNDDYPSILFCPEDILHEKENMLEASPPPLHTIKVFNRYRSSPANTPATPDAKHSFADYRSTITPSTPDSSKFNMNNTSTCSSTSVSSNGDFRLSSMCTPMTPPSPKYHLLSPMSPLSPLRPSFRNRITSPNTMSPMSKRALKNFAPSSSPYEKSLRIRMYNSLQINDDPTIPKVPPPIQTTNLIRCNSLPNYGSSPTALNFSMSPVDLGEMSPGVFCDPTPFDDPKSAEFNLILPTLQGCKNPDCNSIDALTMGKVVNGEYSDLANHLIIDCRFPFEYEGGHIKGAINIFEPEGLEKALFDENRLQNLNNKELIIIFHCEFSQHRAPKLYRHLRDLDRKFNIDCYPKLFYSNIYVMEGGYRGFYNESDECKNYCEPRDYVEMNDKKYQQQCKQSWSDMRRGWSKKKRGSRQMNYLARQR
ncbi:M-phase inducer phosphatase [Acrasis kona]|uniref:protein-tyrosine-phosphatase n=1 Tax=Acrasis kona TaxID=1008807 RepID=A0AAW2YWX1_9EUKA